MKRLIKTALAAAILTSTAMCAYAYDSGRSFLRSEFGIRAGVSLMQFRPKLPTGEEAFASEYKFTNRGGYHGGISIALDFGGIIALEPELIYTYSTMDAKTSFPEGDETKNVSTRINCNSLTVPIVVSVRALRPVRFNVGVVLPIMTKDRYKNEYDNNKHEIFTSKRGIGYVAGIGVVAAQHVLFDIRFEGQFKPSVHNLYNQKFLYDQDKLGIKPEDVHDEDYYRKYSKDFTSMPYAITVSIGYLF